MKRCIILLAFTSLFAGCALFRKPPFEKSSMFPLAMKTVTGKVEPRTLVAFDGSTCMVSEKKWKEAKIGKSYLCVWAP